MGNYLFKLNGYSIIEDHLYLGNIDAALSPKKLKELNIRRVLSILNAPIDGRISKDIHYHWIKSDDSDEEDLLSHFEESYNFINDGLINNQSVYVHCFAGISRSATIVIAFVMKKYQISYNDAIVRVRRERLINPNLGFRWQLKLYQRMGFTLNSAHTEYRNYLLNYMGNHFRYGIFSFNNEHIFERYFMNLERAESIVASERRLNYRCTKCKFHLFNEINIIGGDVLQLCDSLYIEPQKWMLKTIKKNQKLGQITCPNCSIVLGNYKWNRYFCNCPLHTKKCLIFQIDPKKVEKEKSFK